VAAEAPALPATAAAAAATAAGSQQPATSQQQQCLQRQQNSLQDISVQTLTLRTSGAMIKKIITTTA